MPATQELPIDTRQEAAIRTASDIRDGIINSVEQDLVELRLNTPADMQMRLYDLPVVRNSIDDTVPFIVLAPAGELQRLEDMQIFASLSHTLDTYELRTYIRISDGDKIVWHDKAITSADLHTTWLEGRSIPERRHQRLNPQTQTKSVLVAAWSDGAFRTTLIAVPESELDQLRELDRKTAETSDEQKVQIDLRAQVNKALQEDVWFYNQRCPVRMFRVNKDKPNQIDVIAVAQDEEERDFLDHLRIQLTNPYTIPFFPGTESVMTFSLPRGDTLQIRMMQGEEGARSVQKRTRFSDPEELPPNAVIAVTFHEGMLDWEIVHMPDGYEEVFTPRAKQEAALQHKEPEKPRIQESRDGIVVRAWMDAVKEYPRSVVQIDRRDVGDGNMAGGLQVRMVPKEEENSMLLHVLDIGRPGDGVIRGHHDLQKCESGDEGRRFVVELEVEDGVVRMQTRAERYTVVDGWQVDPTIDTSGFTIDEFLRMTEYYLQPGLPE